MSVVARCVNCGKPVYYGQRFRRWTEEGRSVVSHDGCRPPGIYRSPAERFATKGGTGETVTSTDPKGVTA